MQRHHSFSSFLSVHPKDKTSTSLLLLPAALGTHYGTRQAEYRAQWLKTHSTESNWLSFNIWDGLDVQYLRWTWTNNLHTFTHIYIYLPCINSQSWHLDPRSDLPLEIRQRFSGKFVGLRENQFCVGLTMFNYSLWLLVPLTKIMLFTHAHTYMYIYIHCRRYTQYIYIYIYIYMYTSEMEYAGFLSYIND